MAHMDGTWMDDMMWAMWIPSILILAAVLALGVWAVRRFSEPRGDSNPRRILEERFARGEIDADEFRSRLAALEGQR
jgi:putative membrane protein